MTNLSAKQQALADLLFEARRDERQISRRHLITNDAKRVEIAASVDFRFAGGLFR